MSTREARIGAIPSLNALPLTEDLRREPAGSVQWADPSVLAGALHRGDLELALVPQVEVCRDPDYRVVGGLGIACRGPVESILLFSDRPWESVRSVAVDAASRSSVELMRVLFHLEGISKPEIVAAPEELGPDGLATAGVDALLRIGDRALAQGRTSVPRTDLGERWYRSTGLPFVFALWAGRSSCDPALRARVRESAERGHARRTEIAREFSREHPEVIGASEAIEYLTERLHHTIGVEELASIERFATLRREIGSPVPLDWRLRTYEERALEEDS